MIAEIITSVGSLVASIGALIAAINASRKSGSAETKIAKTAKETAQIKAEFMPNHGSSFKDALTRIEKDISSLGHQVGEIRRDAATTHDILGNQVNDLARRIGKIEG